MNVWTFSEIPFLILLLSSYHYLNLLDAVTMSTFWSLIKRLIQMANLMKFSAAWIMEQTGNILCWHLCVYFWGELFSPIWSLILNSWYNFIFRGKAKIKSGGKCTDGKFKSINFGNENSKWKDKFKMPYMKIENSKKIVVKNLPSQKIEIDINDPNYCVSTVIWFLLSMKTE